MDVDSETDVIHAAQHGSDQAWQQLFDRHFDAVYRFCLVLTGTRQDIAEEVTQQVFITAVRRIHHFDPNRAAFRASLFGIAKNRHLTVRDGEQRRRRHEKSSARERSDAVTSGDSELWVHEVLARLSPFIIKHF